MVDYRLVITKKYKEININDIYSVIGWQVLGILCYTFLIYVVSEDSNGRLVANEDFIMFLFKILWLEVLYN